jgi:Glu-tRNA(Gln) amidotransferase subunit E-like FAD-binding protein
METKIEAKLDGERIKVNAKFLEGENVVHEINTAFNLGATEEEIRAEVERQGNLLELEKEQKENQKEVDAKFNQANEVINNLNSN